jgi:glucokinase
MRNAIGIDIGGTNTRAALISEDGGISAHLSSATAQSATAVFAGLQKMIAGLRNKDTVAIGIGVPGRVDVRRKRVMSGGFVDLSTLALPDLLLKDTGLPTFVDNDANMALFAEARKGAAKGFNHAVMLTIGTGIGGAIWGDGKIFHGGTVAGQLGHITVSDTGTLCNCGRHGCLETESSGTALRRQIVSAGLHSETDISDLLRSDDAAARNVVASWATPLRAGIDSLVAAFGPEIVVLGGGLGAAAAAALDRIPALSPWFQYKVVTAGLGSEAGVIGAALAALETAR